MSRRKWIIIAVLALADIIILGAMVNAVHRSLTQQVSPNLTLTETPTISLTPTITEPPAWTPTPSSTPYATLKPSPTSTSTKIPTPWATPLERMTVTLPPTPAPITLENPTFDQLRKNDIPGWQTGGFVNWEPGEGFDPETSYAAPRFQAATDPQRQINGSTLKIDTTPWVKLRAWVFQIVQAEPNTVLQFQVNARGFVKETEGGYIVKAGIDPQGNAGCDEAQWGQEQTINQDDGVVMLLSPEVATGQSGQATVCIFAETQFAQTYHAVYFDDALLTALPSTP